MVGVGEIIWVGVAEDSVYLQFRNRVAVQAGDKALCRNERNGLFLSGWRDDSLRTGFHFL